MNLDPVELPGLYLKLVWAGISFQANHAHLSVRVRHNLFITGNNQALGHISGLKKCNMGRFTQVR